MSIAKKSFVVVSAALLVTAWIASSAAIAGAGGGPPRPIAFDLSATSLGCVDDVVDERGVDGRALVRIRITNVGPEDVTVDGGAWSVQADGVTVAEGTFTGPSELPIDGTYEQIVQIPGDTGPAKFLSRIDVSNEVGQSQFDFEPLEVLGDCPQPEEPTTTTSAAEAPPVAAAATASPRFTG